MVGNSWMKYCRENSTSMKIGIIVKLIPKLISTPIIRSGIRATCLDYHKNLLIPRSGIKCKGVLIV